MAAHDASADAPSVAVGRTVSRTARSASSNTGSWSGAMGSTNHRWMTSSSGGTSAHNRS